MKFAGIQFPDPLLAALRDGRLVVFAGSGVSMGTPACLPNFKSLATSVAVGTGRTLQPPEPEDVFLGKLADRGVQVHALAAQNLQKNRRGDPPRPTELHRDLLRLYFEPESVRMVTTNFDLLFHAAAQDLFDAVPDVFRAPALPLGRSFRGIVHVHGCLDRPTGMVLTDTDFGRAYLTEGWARRFLVDLFRTSTVLFVGYSHNDTVMKYLARALPRTETATRFALTGPADTDRWTILGITPIVYPREPGDNHPGLTRGISGLADYASRGVLDWQREITEIAQKPPPLGEEEADVVAEALTDPAKTAFFTAAASGSEWIESIERRGHFEPLFGHDAPGPSYCQLARWLAEQIPRGHSDRIFLLLARHDMRPHPALWREFAHVVGSPSDPPLDEETLSRWVSCLLATAPPDPERHDLLSFGERCIEAGLTDTLIAVFDALAAFRLSIRPPIAFDDDHDQIPPHLEIELTPDDHDFALNEIWERGLDPKLDAIAEPLLSIAVAHLAARHRTLRAWQKADHGWDPDSWRRHAIEPHEQDDYRKHIDLLIDTARGCLEWLADNRPDAAARWCDEFRSAQEPLLRRLCLHTLFVRRDLAPEAKIDWLLANMDLHDLATHHELFRISRILYPDANREQRERVVEAILAYRFPDERYEQAERLTARHHFDWLHWLSDADPDCALASRVLGDLLETYPDFTPHEHPDLTHWSHTQHGATSPWTVEELLSRPAPEWLDQLLSFRPDEFLGPDRHGLVFAVTEAAKRDFDWGLALAGALSASEDWPADLWTALLRAWREAELDRPQFGQIAGFLGETGLLAVQAGRIADVLLAWLEKYRTSCPHDLLARANAITTELWARIDRSEAPGDSDSWHSLANNRPAGAIARYWLTQLDMLREQPESLPPTLPREVSTALSTIVGDRTIAGRQGSTILAGQLAFLLSVAEQWTQENLLPLFSENPDTDDCQAVWDGFLTAGRLGPHVAEHMHKAFLEALPFLPTRFSTDWRLRRFVEYFTLMLAQFADDPAGKWVPAFFEHADDDARQLFASQIERHLQHMDDAPQREWWRRWLKRYWKNRLRGVPQPLAEDEIRLMIGWLPHFGDSFPAAVDLATTMPPVPLRTSRVLRDLARGDHVGRFPAHVAKILIHLGQNGSPGPQWHGLGNLVDELLGADLPPETQHQLRELAARTG